jgi:hypothetical protein
MSLKFTYNNTEYVFIPVTRTASTSIQNALQASSLIETHFNDDYVEFGYAKGI